MARPSEELRPSFAKRLTDELEELRDAFIALISRSSIVNTDPNRGSGGYAVFVGFPLWGWGPDEALLGDRTRLHERLEEWISLFMLLHRKALPETRTRIDAHLGLLRGWLTREGSDHSVPSTRDKAENEAAAAFRELARLVELGTHGPADTLVVPDTNALIRQPDVALHARSVGSPRCTIVMLTTVVAELDDLKDRGRTEDVRAKATAALRRLKGFRDRGDLRRGVTVEGQVQLRVEHREVQVREVLDWLDPTVPDDRILGGSLDLQARNPSATVVLVTSDMNLQNKAAAVGMPFADPVR
jgi:rRNA-processing protein FCF1